MEHKKILKSLKIIGFIFIILSILEIIFVILFNFTEFNFDDESFIMYEFIYTGDIISFSGTMLWLFLNVSMFCFLVFGIYIYRISKNNKIESRSLAKLMVVIGMVLLMTTFVKMNFLVLLGKNQLNPDPDFESIKFQKALYDFDITSIIPALFWNFFIAINCYYITLGIVVTTFGIKWTLIQEEKAGEKRN